MVRTTRSARLLGFCGIVICLLASGCAPEQPAGGKPAAPAGSSPSSTPATHAAGGVRRIMLMTNGDGPFWDAANAGVSDANRDLKLEAAGFEAVLDRTDGSIGSQIAKLRQYASQTDIAGVGLTAVDAKNVNLAQEMRNLKKKGIAVITFDSDIDRAQFRDARTAFIGTNNQFAGHELGLCAKQLLPDGGKYVTFVGFAGAENAVQRIGGFGVAAGEKFQSADAMTDSVDRSKARENVRNALRNHPDVKVLVGIYSYNAPAIVDVVKELNKRSEVKVVAFDAEPIAIQQMSQGQIDALIVQDPYQIGFQSVKLLKSLITDDEATVKQMLPKLGEPEGDILETGLKIVVPNADSPIQNTGFSPQTEFLTLDKFKDWLKQYKLTGS